MKKIYTFLVFFYQGTKKMQSTKWSYNKWLCDSQPLTSNIQVGRKVRGVTHLNCLRDFYNLRWLIKTGTPVQYEVTKSLQFFRGDKSIGQGELTPLLFVWRWTAHNYLKIIARSCLVKSTGIRWLVFLHCNSFLQRGKSVFLWRSLGYQIYRWSFDFTGSHFLTRAHQRLWAADMEELGRASRKFYFAKFLKIDSFRGLSIIIYPNLNYPVPINWTF